jgi:hypothetical protein
MRLRFSVNPAVDPQETPVREKIVCWGEGELVLIRTVGVHHQDLVHAADDSVKYDLLAVR